MLPPRPEARPPSAPADPAFAALGARMMPDLVATQKVTLAGFRLLDPNGVVIAGREEVGLSLAHLEEMREALQGRFKGVLRVRISKNDQPSLYSMSRGTGMRVFIAMPVIVRDQVAGVVYASRTPSNVFKYLYEQRSRVILAILSMIVPTLLIGLCFIAPSPARCANWWSAPIWSARATATRCARCGITAPANSRCCRKVSWTWRGG